MQSKLFDALLRSFTKMKNNKGSSTEPCGHYIQFFAN